MPSSKGEEWTRAWFERRYGVPFAKARPTCLTNPKTKKCLELDGYNETLKIAFEYNGGQHYRRVAKFQPKEQDFLDQVERDHQKLLLCQKAGIALFVVPDLDSEEKVKTFLNVQFDACDKAFSEAELKAQSGGCFAFRLLPAKMSACVVM